MSKKNLIRHVPLLVLAIIILILPLVAPNERYLLHIIILASIASILATSLRLVYTANVWLVGPIAFYAMGAYGVTLATRAGLSFWLCAPFIGILVAIIAWGFGYVTIRVRGLYFAILSIAFTEVVRLTAVDTLGASTTLIAPPIPSLFGIDFSSYRNYYYLFIALLAITLFILYRVEKSPIGTNFKAVAQNESLAESLGINAVRNKVLALSIAAFFVGITGACFAPYNQTISPQSFTVQASMIVLMLMVVGGVGSFLGPIIGAVVLTFLQNYLPVNPVLEYSIYAALVILILYFLPGGLVSIPQEIQGKDWWQRTKEARANLLARIRSGF